MAFVKSLPVHRFIVPLGRDYFGGKIIGSSAKCPGDIRNLLGKAKIGDLQMTVSIKQ
jgi:hypothetical protein